MKKISEKIKNKKDKIGRLKKKKRYNIRDKKILKKNRHRSDPKCGMDLCK